MVFKEYLVPMRDGTRLYTYCVLPDETGCWPIEFSRSPYDAPDYSPAQSPDSFRALVDAGYAVVHQSCRGTGRSEGVFEQFGSEREDGLDTLEWMRSQPFYNGEVYVQGGSYCSYVHLAYLGTCPPDVKGAVLWVMPTDMYKGMTVNDILKTDILMPWFMRHFHKKQLDTNAICSHYPAVTLSRPLSDALTPYYEDGCPVFGNMLLNRGAWRNQPGAGDGLDALKNLTVPLLLIEGWYDIYIGEGTRMMNELSPEIRKKSALLVGPWPHACRTDASWPIEMPDGDMPADLILDWFELIRTGKEISFVQPGTVKYYTIGENKWHTASAMPEGGRPVDLHLSKGGKLTVETDDETELTYTYDPADPAPFVGGSNAFGTIPSGLRPQPEPNFRPDVLSFVSDPIEEDIDCSGSIKVSLTVKSSAEDTAFFVRLDVLRNGNYLPVQESITTLRRENKNYMPGTETVVTMTLDPVSWRFFKGERLRVDVSSSCWPIYAVHGNTTGPIAAQTGIKTAVNTLVTTRSKITLPTLSLK